MARRTRRLRTGPPEQPCIEVLVQDAAVGGAARHLPKIDAEHRGPMAHRGRGERLAGR
jgi:hypothetical protein